MAWLIIDNRTTATTTTICGDAQSTRADDYSEEWKSDNHPFSSSFDGTFFTTCFTSNDLDKFFTNKKIRIFLVHSERKMKGNLSHAPWRIVMYLRGLTALPPYWIQDGTHIVILRMVHVRYSHITFYSRVPQLATYKMVRILGQAPPIFSALFQRLDKNKLSHMNIQHTVSYYGQHSWYL